ncbi:subtype A tannase [Olsenella sp. kh2p3]|uniref:subtype A tannase n=1 Tax=Olsenella sp. kh2p3 TaxID=1797112 RepID=UPI00091A774E|nr:subtype A tannase [Olsenella sp. kh2p3]SFX02038.1 hypothetical protein SAMN04487823_101199 [Olsenella sp. kh2p3]
MSWTRREFLELASAGAASMGLAACSAPARQQTDDTSDQTSAETTTQPTENVDLGEFKSLALDTSAWKYDADNDVYYQLGLTYCLKPATTAYESLAIFVPGKFFTAEKKGDTYSCTVNEKAVVGGFTPSTAPVLLPINSGTLSPQASPTKYGYDGLGTFLDAGCVYVYAGFRGRSAGYDSSTGSTDLYPGGAPWPVVDLKAAIRYLRYNKDALPCDTSRVFSFGFSAGGGVSALLGSAGDAEIYKPYLDSIGAITHDAEGNAVSDAVFGSASWCPVTSFDTADASYEWMMGQFSTAGNRADGTWTASLSQGLATDYASYINAMDLRDSDDSQLTLDESEGSVYTLGSYASQLLSILDESATNFVSDTTFPYTYTPQHMDDPSFPGDPNLATTRATEAAVAAAKQEAQSSAATDAQGEGASTDAASSADAAATTTTTLPTGTTQVQSTIYDTVQNYFAALNSDYWWINYNVSRQTVSISSLRDFSTHLCPAELSVPAFDAADRSTKTNQLFGIGEESTLHFDQMVGDRVAANADAYASLEGWDESYATAWQDDLEKTDSLDTDIPTRVSMVNPLYFLSGTYGGYGTGSVAPHWRVNEGVFDTSTSLATSANLVLALRHFSGVEDVSYVPVWGQGHVMAERSGTASDNLLSWVASCCE